MYIKTIHMLHLKENIETVTKIMMLKHLQNELSNDSKLINLLDGLLKKYRTEYKNQIIAK